MSVRSRALTCLWLMLAAVTTHASLPLIAVEDRGQSSPNQQTPRQVPRRVYEGDFLPVRSVWLTPGDVQPRTIQARGLRPFFLIGDDPRSRHWLKQRLPELKTLGAIGLVVNVQSVPALASLRQLAPDVTLVPASADDLAQRLPLRHYPVLITATRIEQ